MRLNPVETNIRRRIFDIPTGTIRLVIFVNYADRHGFVNAKSQAAINLPGEHGIGGRTIGKIAVAKIIIIDVEHGNGYARTHANERNNDRSVWQLKLDIRHKRQVRHGGIGAVNGVTDNAKFTAGAEPMSEAPASVNTQSHSRVELHLMTARGPRKLLELGIVGQGHAEVGPEIRTLRPFLRPCCSGQKQADRPYNDLRLHDG